MKIVKLLLKPSPFFSKILFFGILLANGLFSNPNLLAQQSLLNTISGTVQRANGQVLPNITVQLSGDVTATTQTDVNGNYSFPDIMAGSSVTVRPSFGSDICSSDCIDLMDFVLIQAHVANNPALASPFDEVAADINNDGQVTALDYIGLFNFLTNDIPFNNLCWRFIPADHDFSTRNFPEEIRINGIEMDVTANFIGVQIGEVNGCQNNIGDNFLQLNVSSRNVSCSEIPAKITVPITTNNFFNIRGLRFGIEWDASQITYTGVSSLGLPNLSLTNFSTGNTNTGQLGFTWPSAIPETVADGTMLFALEFDVINNAGTNISIGNNPFPQQVIDGNFSSSIPIVQNGAVIMVGCDSTGTDSTGMVCDNGALDFDGIDDFVQITNPLSGDANFTFEAWIKSDDNRFDFQRVLGMGGNDTRFELGLRNGNLRLFYFSPSETIDVNKFLADNQWHHLAVVRNGSNVEVFVDGISEIVDNGIQNFDFSGNLRLGRWAGGGTTSFFHGQMDEVKLWNSPKNISDIIATQNCQLDGNEQGLLFYYDFNQGLGGGNNQSETTILDRSTSQANGELINFALTGAESNWVCSELTIADDCVCEPAFTYQLTDSCGTVQFMNQSTGTNLSFLWNFGDGNTSNLENPTHTYAVNGNYQVTLTIFNNDNCDHSTQQNVSIVIDNINPVITCLSGLSVDLGNNGTVSINPNDFIQSLTDNCGIDSVFTMPNSLNCNHLGTTDIIITAVDINGNMSSCTTSVQVTDGGNVCPPNEPFFAYGLSHEPTGQINFNPGDDLEVLTTDDSGAQGFNISLGAVDGFAVSMLNPKMEIYWGASAGFEIEYYGELNGEDNVLLYTEKHELIEMDGERYFMVKLDNHEEEPIIYCIVGQDETLYYDSETGEIYYFYQPMDSDKEIAFTLSFLDDKSSMLYSENPLRVIPKDLNSGEVVETSKIMVLKGNTSASHITRAELRYTNFPNAKITNESIILFEDKLTNTALGETPFNGAILSASQSGNLLTVSNLNDVEQDGLEIIKEGLDDDSWYLTMGVDWQPLSVDNSANFKLAIGARGQLDGGEKQTLSRILIENNPNGGGYSWHPEYSLLGIDLVNITILDDEQVQGSSAYVQGQGTPLLTNELPDRAEYKFDGNGRILYHLKYRESVDFQLDGRTIQGNHVLFSYDQDPGLIEFPVATLTAQGIDEIVITNEEFEFFPSPADVNFNLSDVNGSCGDEICMDLTVDNFQNVGSADFYLNFDPNVLSLVSAANNLNQFTGVLTNNAPSGELQVQFTSVSPSTGSTLADGTLFTRLCFDITATTQQATSVYFSGGPNNQILLSDNNQQPLNFVPRNGVVEITNCENEVPIFQCGDLIATCEPVGSGLYAVGLYNLQDIANAPLNSDWGNANPPITAYHGPNNNWTRSNLGHVFGIAIDDNNGNFYLTATNVYGTTSSVNPNHGGVYMINGTDGSITNIINLPNSIGPALTRDNNGHFNINHHPELGNICFDPDNQQLFVTNFEDGKIYRLMLDGTQLSVFDPLSPDGGIAGFAPLGERLWGIGYDNQSIYYSVWSEDVARPGTNQNSIRKVDLVGGDFDISSDQKLFDVPDRIVAKSTGQNDILNYSSPVSDIAFSQDGTKMILAQRSMDGDVRSSGGLAYWAHKSKVLEYENQSGAWVAQNTEKYVIGSNAIAFGNNVNSANSSGGVDFGFSSYDVTNMQTQGCDEKVWASGDALHYASNDLIYGLMGIPATGGNIANSILIDLDGQIQSSSGPYKTDIGDVEVWQCGDCENTPCEPIVICPSDTTIFDCPTNFDPFNLPGPIIVENCGLNIGINQEVENIGGDACDATFKITYFLTDFADFSDTCMQIVQVMDTLAPAIICPPDITIDCQQIPDTLLTGSASVTDNCPNPTIIYRDSVVSSDGCPIEIHRIWIAMDNCGNADSCKQIITIDDQTPPVLNCLLQDVTVQLDNNCMFVVPDYLRGVTVEDDCTTKTGIAVGGENAFGIKRDGTLWGWGGNGAGTIGLGHNNNPITSPTQAGTDMDWICVDQGIVHSLGIKSDGTLWAWGSDAASGLLGQGNSNDYYSPQQIGTDTDWKTVVASNSHSLAIKQNGTLWAWGTGILGFGGQGTVNVPQQIGTDSDWKQVSASLTSTLAIKYDGSLWAWGVNNNGQLGLGHTNNVFTSTRVGTDNDWAKVQASNHALAIKSDGTLWSWGTNQSGQLGLNNTQNQSTPQPVGTDTDWKSIAIGYDHSVAIKDNGTLWLWGSNQIGQLGSGLSNPTLVPTQASGNIANITDWISIEASDGVTLALRPNGQLWLAGWNSSAFTLPLNDVDPHRGSVTLIQTPAAGTVLGKGDHTITITATDACNNQDDCSITITAEESVPPVVSCPPDQTVNGVPDATGNCNALVQIPLPTATDNCGQVTLINDYNQSSDASDTYPVGTTTITWTGTDDCGNMAQCTTKVTVLPCDNMEPTDSVCGWSVATCYGFSGTDAVGVIIDTRFNSQAPTGNDWGNPTLSNPVNMIHPPGWTLAQIGNVFGTALDHSQNIYLAASDIYRYDSSGVFGFISAAGPIGGTAGVYKTDFATLTTNPIVTTTNIPALTSISGTALPNMGGVGNGIGNIAYDAVNDQLFLTNLEDGRIYRVSTSGTLLSAYDPFNLDSGVPGFQEIPSERIWGIGVYTEGGVTKVYFAREASSGNSKRIYSIPLNAGEFASPPEGTVPGLFTGSSQELTEIDNIGGSREKFTDLAFAFDGTILMAERGGPHNAQVFEYKKISSTWTFEKNYFVGPGQGDNSAGGVDYGYKEENGNVTAHCDSLVWASGNCLIANAINNNCNVYGIEGMSSAGNPFPTGNSITDLYIDYDQDYFGQQKRQIGDIELFKCDCPAIPEPDCDSLMVMISQQSDASCCYNVDIKNNYGPQISKLQVEVCSPGVIFNTAQINAANGFQWAASNSDQTLCITHSSGSIPAGMSNILSFCYTDVQGTAFPNPQDLKFTWFQTVNGVEVPTECMEEIRTNCPPPPPKDTCLTVTPITVTCNPNNPYEYFLDFTVTNLSSNTAFQAFTINLFGLPNGYFFKPCTGTSAPMSNISLPIAGGPLGAGQTSNTMCVKVISTVPIYSPTQLCLQGKLIGLPDCCTSDEQFCFTIEPCCNNCESTSIIANRIGQDTSCCYSLDLDNQCPYPLFHKIEIEVTNSDVTFGNYALGTPYIGTWSLNGSTNKKICLQHGTGTITSGNFQDIVSFCLDNIEDGNDVPQDVIIRWLTKDANMEDSLACDTMLSFECQPPIDYECLSLDSLDIVCRPDSNKYRLTFKVTNHSNVAFSANFLDLLQLAPPDLQFFPSLSIPLSPPLANGDSRWVSICVNDTDGLPGSSDLVFIPKLRFQQDDTCCYKGVADTISLPACDTMCTPVVICPQDTCINLLAGETGIIVNYPPPVDINDCGVEIICTPPSGSFFECGTTTVLCTITDIPTGDQTFCEFDVIVKCDPNPPMRDTCEFVNNETPGGGITGAGVIDFENISDYTTSSNEPFEIDNAYFENNFCLRFYEDNIGGNSPKIGKVGDDGAGNGVGYNRDSGPLANAACGQITNTTRDMPNPGQNVGCYFLTTNSPSGPKPLIIDYQTDCGCMEASGVIMDIDGAESWKIEAFDDDLASAPIFTQIISSGDSGTGDAVATQFVVGPLAVPIEKIIISYNGSGSPGFAFDNFSACAIQGCENEVATKTFSTTITPDQNQPDLQYLEAAIQNHKKEYVGLGVLSRGNSEHDLYFVKTDDQGNVLPDPKKLVFTNIGANLDFSLNTTIEGKTHFFKEIDVQGVPDGYILAASFDQNGLKGGLVARLSDDGCVVWAKKLKQLPNEDIYIRGIVQNPAEDFVCLVQRNSLTPTSIIEIGLNGSVCQRLDYQNIGGTNFLQPTALTLVDGLPNAAAQYALCGTHSGAGVKNIGVYLLDGSFQPFNNTLYVYNVGASFNNNLTPSAIIQDGNDLVMTGYRTNSGELVGFMQKITPFAANGNPDGTSKWFYEYEIGNTVAGNSEHDVLYDLVKTPDNKLVTTGLHADNLANQTRAILFQVDANGIPEWAYQYNESDFEFSNSKSVVLANDNGFVLSGSKISTDVLNTPAQFWMAKTDPNGMLRDCDCVDTTCVIANLIVPVLNTEQWEGITEMCSNTDLQNTCTMLPAVQDFCDQYCPPDTIGNMLCDSLIAEVIPDNSQMDSCCYDLIINNINTTQSIAAVQISAPAPTTITSVTPLVTGWTFDPIQSILIPPNNSLPIGGLGAVAKICTDNFVTKPHEVCIDWLGQGREGYEQLCKDTLLFDCDTLCLATCIYTCPQDITVFENDPITPNDIGMPSIIGACDPNSLSFTDQIVLGSPPCDYLIQRTWTTLDSCDNELACMQIITVDCRVDTCCDNEEDFLKRAANININPVFEECKITVNATLDTCDLIWYDWGDGSAIEGPYMNNTPVSHNYNPTGPYQVCYIIAEEGPSGDTCWSYRDCLLREVQCEPECTCGGFDDITFGQPNVFVQPTKFACNRPAKEIDCPPANTIYELIGNNFCNGGCKMTKIKWTLNRNGGFVAMGSNDLNGGATGFLFEINSNLFSQPGNYSIALTGDCDTESCECIIEFTVPESCGPGACTCGNFKSLQLHNGDGSIVDLDCEDQVVYNLKCPTENRYIFFDYECPDGECPWNKVVTYKLTNQSTNDTITGTVNLNVVPGGGSFPLPVIPLPETFFENPGLYTLELTTFCGDKECVCTIEFVSQCPNECTCEDFFDDWYTDTPNDWPQGSNGFIDITDWFSGCQLNLQPRNMENCDKISWTLKDLTDNTQDTKGTGGNAEVTFPIISGHLYELEVNITRFADDGGTCSLNYIGQQTLYCGGSQGLVCGADFINNPSFATSIEGWRTISGAPEYVAEGGSDGNGYVLLSGNKTRQDAIGQILPVKPSQNTYYKVSLDVNPISVLPGTRLVVKSYRNLPNGTLCEDNCEVIGQIIFDGQGDEDWPPQDPMFTKYMFNSIVFHIENDYPDGGELGLDAKIGIDNICIDLVEDDFTCPDNILQNGGFTKGAVMGNLGVRGNADSWDAAFGNPMICIDEETKNATLWLKSDRNQKQAVQQQVGIIKDDVYELSTIIIDWSDGDASTTAGCHYSCITYVASEEPLLSEELGDDAEVIGRFIPEMLIGEGSKQYTLPPWKANRNYNYITMILDEPTELGEPFALVPIDDICLRKTDATPPDCCASDSLYADQVAQGFDFTKIGCDLQVSPKALDPCMEVVWNWGDGNTTGPLGAQQSATHTFTTDGTVTVCMIAQVIEDDSTCFQAQYCQDLTFDCAPSECCLGFSDFTFTDGTTIFGTGNCGDQVTFLQCDLNGDLFEMKGNFACAEDCLNGPINYTITNLSTNTPTNGQVVPISGVFQIPLGTHGPFNPGNYELALSGTCGPDSCATCTIKFNIKACADECCIDFTDFENQVNQGFKVSKTCEMLTLQPNGLDECDFVTWRWGDNSITNSTANSPVFHNYSINGVSEMEFEVCMEVYRFDNQGNICLETLICEQITVENCCSCEDFEVAFDADLNCGLATFTPQGVYNNCDVVKWKWGDNTTIGETTGTEIATHQYATKQGYVVEMTVFRNVDGVSCGQTISKNISVDCISTSLENIIANQQIKIFPNPTNSNLFIALEKSLAIDSEIRILNIWGQLIYDFKSTGKLSNHEILMDGYAAGIYLLEIQEEEFIYRKKVVKQ